MKHVVSTRKVCGLVGFNRSLSRQKWNLNWGNIILMIKKIGDVTSKQWKFISKNLAYPDWKRTFTESDGNFRIRLIGGTYHIFLAYWSGLNFSEYHHNSYGQNYGTFTYLHRSCFIPIDESNHDSGLVFFLLVKNGDPGIQGFHRQFWRQFADPSTSKVKGHHQYVCQWWSQCQNRCSA